MIGGMELVGYLRVSSDGQLDGYGLATQERAVKAWAKANGIASSGCAETRACQARSMLSTVQGSSVRSRHHDRRRQRPGGRPSRPTARALTVQEAALAVFWKLGARVFTADAGEVARDDPDDPMRTAIRQVFGVFAQLDRAMVTKRLRDGRAAKAATGRKAVGAYAYGYRPSGKGAERDAASDEAEQVAVRRIGELRREGRSYRDIAKVLDAELRPRPAFELVGNGRPKRCDPHRPRPRGAAPTRGSGEGDRVVAGGPNVLP